MSESIASSPAPSSRTASETTRSRSRDGRPVAHAMGALVLLVGVVLLVGAVDVAAGVVLVLAGAAVTAASETARIRHRRRWEREHGA